ncbi:MAG: hypothetical protein FWF04_01005 [Clostridiales bacterium]|nr:hypothetical protein [Clostridiales bacterium]
MVSSSSNAQLQQPVYEQHSYAGWKQTRLELLKPQQRQRKARRRLEVLSYGLLAVLLFCLALTYMYLEAQINVAGREVNTLQKQVAETRKLSLISELEIGNLSSLSRVESYAKMQLGMVYPDVKSVHYLDHQVSVQLAADLQALTEEASAENIVAEEQQNLFKAWMELISGYLGDIAWAVED